LVPRDYHQGRVHMRKLIKRLVVVSVVGLPVVAGVIVPAGQSGAATSLHAVLSTKAGPDVTPNSTIKGKGKKAKYKPTALTFAEGTETSCGASTPFTSFTITNPGKKPQYITVETGPSTYSAFGTLPGKTIGEVCLYGGSAGDTITFGLSNPTGSVNYKSHLVGTASD
jgi:hypothetical protein